MTPITFQGYSLGSNQITIIAERIVSWEYISYNGRGGTQIQLDTGKSILVDDAPYVVERMLKNALNQPK